MQDNINFILTILGTILSIVFGILSIDLFKKKKYPGRITFIEERATGLFASLVKNFPQIAISYENQPINQQIVLLRGFIINQGIIDINESMVEERLALKLPDGFKWLTAKIVDASEGSKANVQITDSHLYFNLGLFKKNEFVRFEALLDVPVQQSSNISSLKLLREELKFVHRIADTAVVETKTSDLEIRSIKSMYEGKLIPYIMMVVFPIFLFIYSLNIKPNPAAFTYYLKDGSKNFVLADPQIDNTVEVILPSSGKIAVMKQSEFYSKIEKIEINDIYKTNTVTNFVVRNIHLITMTMAVVLFAMSVRLIVNRYLEFKRIKRLRVSLNLDKKSA